MRNLVGTMLLAMLPAVMGCHATLESDLQERQADAVIVALHARGIGASKEASRGTGGGYDVTVAPDDVGPALRVLREAGLPAAPDPGLNEVFGEGGIVPTATEERARYSAALGGELAASLERIEGVLDARVHVAMPSGRGLLDEARPRPRASVLIKHRAGPPPYEEPAVRALVAGAIVDMRLEDVSVVGVAAPPASDTRQALVAVGPVSVTRGSSRTLKTLMAASLAIHAILALLLVFVLASGRKKLRTMAARAEALQQMVGETGA